jgi:superfamily II DNA or RNA helicase
MVGIQRVLEGTDWPVCSAVYCVEMPGSLNTVFQFLGRAMRLKGEDYPAAQREPPCSSLPTRLRCVPARQAASFYTVRAESRARS